MTDLLHKELTGHIIGAYYSVYNELSQTYPEFIYEQAMISELRRHKITCVRQDEYEIWYKDWFVGRQRLDLFVADNIVVELKVADKILPIHLAQLLSYLKTLQKEVGLLFRFGGPTPEFERRILTPRTWETHVNPQTPKSSIEAEGWLYPDLVYEVVAGLLEVFRTLGPGFIHRIYANACYYELRMARGLEIQPRSDMDVYYKNEALSGIKLAHIQIDNRLMVFPVAISQLDNIRIHNLKEWMARLNIPIGILANFNDSKLTPLILRIA